MGKSAELQQEAKRIKNSTFLTARHFLSYNIENYSQWRVGPLFIDGLDEVRATEQKTILHEIAFRLKSLGNPEFRLSCRSVSWLDINVWKEFDALVKSDSVQILKLNPLDDPDIHLMITEHGFQATDFISQAYQHELDPFLKNPLLLKLLLKCVKIGLWPSTLTEIFEIACTEIVKENSYQENESSSALPSEDGILTAAGQLATLLLISNKTGWALENSENIEVASLKDVEAHDPTALNIAIHSGLFNGNHQCRIPFHQLVAEYLSANYLYKRIQKGLNAKLVLDLLIGNKSAPVADLKGLLAWFATLNPDLQSVLCFADPVAVIYYGKLNRINQDNQQDLLSHLAELIDPNHDQFNEFILGVISDDLDDLLISSLMNAPRFLQNKQLLMYTLLKNISRLPIDSRMDPKISLDGQTKINHKNLLRIIYDTSWESKVRCEGVHALNFVLSHPSDRYDILGSLILDLKNHVLRDEGYQLLGTMLGLLYPNELEPHEVWDYLDDWTIVGRSTIYHNFWKNILENSDSVQSRKLLYSLCKQASEVTRKLMRHGLGDVVLSLLSRGLYQWGDGLTIPELHHCFKVVEFDDSISELVPLGHKASSDYSNNHAASAEICDWLHERKDIRYGLIECDLIAQEYNLGVRPLNVEIALKFVGLNPPKGFRRWCLNNAAKLWDYYPRAAARLAEWSIHPIEGWGKPLSDEAVAKKSLSSSHMNQWNQRRLHRINQDPSTEIELKPEHVKNREALQKQSQEKIEKIRQQSKELSTGSCPPALLHHLAETYFTGFAKEGEFQIRHLESYLENDKQLLQSALSGFRSVLRRDDLPSLEQIADLHQNKQISYFAYPFLAAMELEDETILDKFSEKERRRAIGFYQVTDLHPYYCDSSGIITIDKNNLRPWYEHALLQYPEVVADSLVMIHNASVQAKSSVNQHVFKMAFDKRYVQIIPLAVMRMFTAFPTRSNKYQRESLRLILWSAIQSNGKSTENLRNIVFKRLNRKKMDIAQRAIWIGAALYTDRTLGLPALVEHLSKGQESRIRQIFNFLVPNVMQTIASHLDDWSSQEITMFIQTFSKRLYDDSFEDQYYSPHNVKGFYGDKFEFIFHPCIKNLSERCDKQSLNFMDSLLNDPNLKPWQEEISQLQHLQLRRSNGVTQSALSVKQIQKYLDGISAVA